MNERTIRAEMLLGAEAMEKLKNAHVACSDSAESAHGAPRRSREAASGILRSLTRTRSD